MRDETGIVAKPIDPNGELYQRRALQALPILVRQAIAGQPIYYGEIARELDMPNPRNMNYVLGSVGASLRNLSQEWNEPIPPLQVLAINVKDDLPGEGFAEFMPDSEAFKNAPLYQQRRIIEEMAARVRVYPRWRDVLAKFGAEMPPGQSLESLLPQDIRVHFGGQGESESHRVFKFFVAAHAGDLHVSGLIGSPEIEYCFASGDAVDVLFTTRTALVAAEVKSRLSSDTDVLRGIFQCVKYGALLEATATIEQRELATRAVLVLEGGLLDSLRTISTTLGVEVFEHFGTSRGAA